MSLNDEKTEIIKILKTRIETLENINSEIKPIKATVSNAIKIGKNMIDISDFSATDKLALIQKLNLKIILLTTITGVLSTISTVLYFFITK
jgi:hypothetical protein